MNRPSIPTQNQPPSGRSLPDGLPAELATRLPPGNVVVLGGPGSGKTALLEATMHHLLAEAGGSARFLTSSRQAARSALVVARSAGALPLPPPPPPPTYPSQPATTTRATSSNRTGTSRPRPSQRWSSRSLIDLLAVVDPSRREA